MTNRKEVDGGRDDLFRRPFDPLPDFLSRELSRRVVVRHRYGQYEYSVHVYSAPSATQMVGTMLRASAPLLW